MAATGRGMKKDGCGDGATGMTGTGMTKVVADMLKLRTTSGPTRRELHGGNLDVGWRGKTGGSELWEPLPRREQGQDGVVDGADGEHGVPRDGV